MVERDPFRKAGRAEYGAVSKALMVSAAILTVGVGVTKGIPKALGALEKAQFELAQERVDRKIGKN